MKKEKLIEKVSSLIKEIESGIEPLSAYLRKSIAIYEETGDSEFQRFVKSELNGYENDQVLPKYRTGFQTIPVGIYHNKLTGAKDEVNLKMEAIFKAAKMDPKEANLRSLPHSVVEMEHYLENADTTDMKIGFTYGQVAIVQKFSYETDGWELVDGYFKFSKSAFPKILSSVKALLLEFLYKIKKTYEADTEIVKTGFFENGSPFDALITVSEIMKTAKKEILLVDAYIDEKTLSLFSFKKPHIKIKILTHPNSLGERLDLFKESFNKQYQNLEIRASKVFHDRFLIIDSNECYHLGASLKDLGKSVFMFSKIEDETILIALKEKIKKEYK